MIRAHSQISARGKIATLLTHHIGLNPSSIGLNSLNRTIENRRQACQIRDLSGYLQHLQQSPKELEALVEAIVVPETWFFRDREPFNFLRQSIPAKPHSSSERLKILSIEKKACISR